MLEKYGAICYNKAKLKRLKMILKIHRLYDTVKMTEEIVVRFKDMFIKATTTVLLFLAVLSAPFVATSCGQRTTEEQPTTKIEIPTEKETETNKPVETPTEKETEKNTEQNTEPPVVVPKDMIDVVDVVDSVFKGYDFDLNYKTTLANALINTVEDASNMKIKNTTFVIDETNGEVVVSIEKTNPITNWAQYGEIKLVGDTTGIATFLEMSSDKDEIIAEVLVANGLSLSGSIEKDSEAHKALLSDLQILKTDYDMSRKEFENSTFIDLTPREQVAVVDIVNSVFGDVDFYEDLSDCAQAALTARSANYELKKLHVVDFVLDTEGNISYYVNVYNKKQNSTTLRKINMLVNTDELPEYVGLSMDFEKTISDYLATKELTIHSTVDKGSRMEEELREELLAMKENYYAQKQQLIEITKDETAYFGLAGYHAFTTSELAELGIEDTNAFAEALLNNTAGTGYENVTGWTMDDVVATYVGECSTWNGITKYCDFRVYVVTDKGINSVLVGVTSENVENFYSFLINNSENSQVVIQEEVVMFSENAVVFDEDGNMVERTAEAEVIKAK